MTNKLAKYFCETGTKSKGELLVLCARIGFNP